MTFLTIKLLPCKKEFAMVSDSSSNPRLQKPKIGCFLLRLCHPIMSRIIWIPPDTRLTESLQPVIAKRSNHAVDQAW
jgi:hypothetical protein